MPMSRSAFAATIKAKYPDYASVPDDDLVTRIIAKYPAYASQVESSRGATAAPPSPQPGAVERFLQGMGLPTSVAALETMSRHYNNPAGPAVTMVADLAHTIGSEMGTQAGEGIDAAQHGEVRNAARHALGAAIPLVGPPAAEGNLAGAAGRATSLALPVLAGKMFPKATEATPPPAQPPMSEFQQFGGTGNLQRPPSPNVNVTNVRLGPFEPQGVPDNIPPENMPSPRQPSGQSVALKVAGMLPVVGKIIKGVATAKDVALFVRDVMGSENFRQAASAPARSGFIQALNSKDMSGIANYGQAILAGNQAQPESNGPPTEQHQSVGHENEFLTYDPKRQTYVGENDALIQSTPIDELLGPRFGRIVHTTVGASPINGNLPQGDIPVDKYRPHLAGVYGRPLPDETRLAGGPPVPDMRGIVSPSPDYRDVIQTDKSAGLDTELHEYGHAIWHKGMYSDEKARYIAAAKAILDRANTMEDRWAARNSVPLGILLYQTELAHSFEPIFAAYVQTPSGLKAKAPELYNVMKGIIGREYIQGAK